MFDVKKVFAKILQSLTVEREHIATGIIAYRYGRVVTINMDVTNNITPQTAGYVTLGATKFKPSERLVFTQMSDTVPYQNPDGNDRLTMFGSLDTNGNIQVYVSTPKRTIRPRGSITYIIGGVIHNILKALQSLSFKGVVVC